MLADEYLQGLTAEEAANLRSELSNDLALVTRQIGALRDRDRMRRYRVGQVLRLCDEDIEINNAQGLFLIVSVDFRHVTGAFVSYQEGQWVDLSISRELFPADLERYEEADQVTSNRIFNALRALLFQTQQMFDTAFESRS